MTAEDDLADLRRQAEAAQRTYWQARSEIDAQHARLAEARADLQALGCDNLTAADLLAADLQADLDRTLTEIRDLL